ncbi:hypothetical protein TYRP_002987 [Tyrophagus putrescentiae]|nr:hypothetical protein TYRP_002987 [Tyrophagus putrescentiae]
MASSLAAKVVATSSVALTLKMNFALIKLKQTDLFSGAAQTVTETISKQMVAQIRLLREPFP